MYLRRDRNHRVCKTCRDTVWGKGDRNVMQAYNAVGVESRYQ